MSLDKRINAFVELGRFLSQFKSQEKLDEMEKLNEQFYEDFNYLIDRQKALNGWFTKRFVLDAIDAITGMLQREKLEKWLSRYDISIEQSKKVGVIMAGNIPLVGFHDFLTVLILGNELVAKTSSEDSTLIKKIAEVLIAIEPDFSDKIKLVEKLENFDVVIATGSNNTARYFDYYFGKYPNIIRKNRNSVAVITENDSTEELKALGKDIFQYFGLGCRNVSKLYVPENYDFKTFFEALFDDFKDIIDNNKYANNYDYNKAVYLLGSHQLLDNNFLLLKEEKSLSSPVAVLHYEYYNNLDELKQHLKTEKENIQCVVSNNTEISSIKFGQAQKPELWDYADGVDTMDFLIGN